MKPRSNSRSRRPDSGGFDKRKDKKDFSSKPRSTRREDGEGSSDKPYERKSSSRGPSSGRPYQKKSFDKKPYGRDERPERKSGFIDTAKERGEEKTSYERKTYVRKSFDKKPYSRPGGDDRRSSSRDSDTEGSERKPYSRPDRDDTKKPYKGRDDRKKSYGDRGERKSYGDSDRRNNRDEGGEKWNRKEKHEFYGERKSYSRGFSQKLSQKKSTYSDEPDKRSGDLIRLNKYISNSGVCSRREADELIESGAITVNGEIVSELGYKVKPGDVVKYNTQTLRSEKNVYLLLNKPKDFITTMEDPQDRKTVMWLIKDKCKERIYPVGRLDRNTTGVLLFTNDGDLAKKLTHPSFQVEKIYQATLDKNLKTDDFEKLEKGVELEDGFIKPDVVSFVGPDKSVIGIEIHSGRNKIVRRMFEHLGYDVVKLDRVVFAGLTKKDLPRGRSRFLTPLEVANLKMITGRKNKKTVASKDEAELS
jgi:23S rRNA pseudouridine2605 synthase